MEKKHLKYFEFCENKNFLTSFFKMYNGKAPCPPIPYPKKVSKILKM